MENTTVHTGHTLSNMPTGAYVGAGAVAGAGALALIYKGVKLIRNRIGKKRRDLPVDTEEVKPVEPAEFVKNHKKK